MGLAAKAIFIRVALPSAPHTLRLRLSVVVAYHQQTVQAGSTWFLIAAKWWDAWCAYSGFSPDAGCVKNSPSGDRPGTIDNSSLIDAEYREEGILRKDIQEGVDYALVEERAASILQEIYGGGPVIARAAIAYGARKKVRVDLHPIYIALIECDKSGAAIASTRYVQSFTAKTTFSDVQEMRHNLVVQTAQKAEAQPPPLELPGVDADMVSEEPTFLIVSWWKSRSGPSASS